MSDIKQRMPSPDETKKYGLREDGTAKGPGYFGELSRLDKGKGRFSTELSGSGDVTDEHGNTVLYPLIHGESSREEIEQLLKGDVRQSHYNSAEHHARSRMKAGKSPFADHGEQKPLPKSLKESFKDGYREETP